MEPIIIGSKRAIKIAGIGWCWYYDNYGDDKSFDYCVAVCNEQEKIMLDDISKRSPTTASTGQPDKPPRTKETK